MKIFRSTVTPSRSKDIKVHTGYYDDDDNTSEAYDELGKQHRQSETSMTVTESDLGSVNSYFDPPLEGYRALRFKGQPISSYNQN